MQTTVYEVSCKRCGKKFKYSGRSRAETLEHGLSAPEYCDDCQQEERQMRSSMGAPYFHVAHIIDELVPGPLGIFEREKREHIATVVESGMDESQIGMTTDNVREIAEWFSDPNRRVVIVEGPTGSGKSTALPFWMVYPPEGIDPKFFTKDGMILVTQPRINAVEGPSGFVGKTLMGSDVGKGMDVGLSHSDVDKTDWHNALCYVTDGKLVNLAAKGRLGQFGIIVVDEAHERSENIEQIMAVLKERLDLYPHLKLVIASATIDTSTFMRYFEVFNPKLLSFEGSRTDKHGNEVEYFVEHATDQEALPYDDPELLRKQLYKGVMKKVQWLIREVAEGRGAMGTGDILVFLHSTKVIDKMVEELKGWVKSDKNLSKLVEVHPLYSARNKKDRDKATEGQLPGNRFRVILGTNYAEASVTFGNLAYVIETGVMIVTWFNAQTNKTEYPLGMIGRDNARQRWGRTGRTRNGVVYTTYSERQFYDDDVFPEFQVPTLERVNMESSLLAAKEAGIVNPESIWLANVDSDEAHRATGELVSTGALDEEGALTEYGMMLRHMSYPARIVDMLMRADDVGCLVEMATLLPIIMNDNKHRRSLLKTNKNWDVYTKYQAYRRHAALMAGCIDDIEFVLKLYLAWDKLPWLDQDELDQLDRNESEKQKLLDQLRKQWSQVHYVNHETLVEIRKERDVVLQQFNIGMHTDVFRPIEPALHGKVIEVIVELLGSSSLKKAMSPYVFDVSIEPDEDTFITCFASDSIEADQQTTFSRLFAEQVYPIGFRFLARVRDDRGRITTFRNLTRSEELEEQYTLFVEDDDSYDDEEEEEVVEESGFDIKLHKQRIQYDFINCLQFVENTDDISGSEIEVEIVGYDYQGSRTIVLARAIPNPSEFELFVEKYRRSDEISVRIAGQFQMVRDYQVSLVVHEQVTGLQIFVAPDDMSFSRDSSIVQRLQKGQILKLNIENIDKELQRVRLSNWEGIENIITKELDSSERHDSSAIVAGDVVSIYDDGKIMLLLDNSDLETGSGILATIFPERLPKSFREYSIGDRMAVRIERRSNKIAFVSLAKLPDKAKNQIPDTEIDGLFYREGKLQHKGPMPYEDLYEYKTISNELEYIQALEKLYWFSNRISIAEVVDVEAYERGMRQYPQGSFIHGATISEISDRGVFINLGQGEMGYVFQANVLGDVRRNTFSTLSVGQRVNVRVKSYNTAYEMPELEITEFTYDSEDPLNQLSIGSIVTAAITSVKDDDGYIYVELDSGVSGRVHFKQMYLDTRDTKLSDIYKDGMRIKVKVHKVDTENRLVDFDMRIPDHDPIGAYREGNKYKGVVKSIKSYGIFVNIGYNIEALVHGSEMYVPRNKDLNTVFTVGQEVVVLLKDKSNRDKLELSMLIPEYEHLDPEKDLKVGAKRIGVVQGIQSYGYFITIADGIQGLLRAADIPEVSTGFLGLGGKKKPVLSEGMQVEVVINDIRPNKKNPNKKDYSLGFIKTR